MGSFNYDCYGMRLRSEMALPELQAASERGAASGPNVEVSIGPVAANGLGGGKPLGPFLWATARELWLQVPNVARFLVRDGREIVIDPHPGIDEDSVRVFLLGSALGALLLQRGRLVLHGNAVRIGGRCLICVGRSGVGKSTLAAGFLRRGYDVLADDVVAVDGECRVLPGFPRIKLWQDAADRFGIDTRELPRIRPQLAKYNYPLAPSIQGHALDIAWVYVLDTHHQSQILFEPILGMARFRFLRVNTYRVRFLEGMALKAEHLKLCGKLAGKIRLARITRPEQGCEPDVLIDRILADVGQCA